MSDEFTADRDRDPDVFTCLGCGREITRDVEPSGVGWWIDEDPAMAAVCINSIAPDGLHTPDLNEHHRSEPPC